MLSKKATTPIATGDRVSSHTNQLWAMFCMKSPELEMSAPSRRRRKFRCRIVRRGLFPKVFARVAAASGVSTISVAANVLRLQRLEPNDAFVRAFANRPRTDLRFTQRAEQANFAGNFVIR